MNKYQNSPDNPFEIMQETPSKIPSASIDALRQKALEEDKNSLKNHSLFTAPNPQPKSVSELLSILDDEYGMESSQEELEPVQNSSDVQPINQRSESEDLPWTENSSENEEKLAEDVYNHLTKSIKNVKETVKDLSHVHSNEKNTVETLQDSLNDLLAQSEQETKLIAEIENTRQNVEKDRQEVTRLKSLVDFKMKHQTELEQRIAMLQASTAILNNDLAKKKEEHVHAMHELDLLEHETERSDWFAFSLFVFLLALVYLEFPRLSAFASHALGFDYVPEGEVKSPY